MGKLMPYHRDMAELVFEVVQEADGGYCAEPALLTVGDITLRWVASGLPTIRSEGLV
jgi:hypothetical protein